MATPDEGRSKTMRAVRSTDTKPELLVRSVLHGLVYRFRLHQKDFPGKPDLVFSLVKKSFLFTDVFGMVTIANEAAASQRLILNTGKERFLEIRPGIYFRLLL
uniref:Very-short-patch mismatch repair endonuclease n=1 Tax=Polaromonas sp. W5N TaxID=1840315 RepID=A0A2S1FIM8_9BURK|nr:very-short-patch mismatch repair endonuclease [Polaromonas sp. W5N]